MNLDTYEINGEWDLKDSGWRSVSIQADQGRQLKYLSFFVTLARKPTYFVLKVLTPRYDQQFLTLSE